MSFKTFKDNLFDNPYIFDTVRWVLLGSYKPMKRTLKRNMGYQKGDTILDIGCGTGIFSTLFRQYEGFDATKTFIKAAKKKYPKKIFTLGDARELPYKENSFDHVLLLSFIHFLKNEETKNLLNKSGKIARKRVLIIEPVLYGNAFSKFFFGQNRGHNIKKISQLREEISQELNITKIIPFTSLLYPLVLFVCEPKQE
jgi:ubiquinone/menaquinone biosynthesis C-methylase UbiE